jgi:5'-deoxynucleotidase YfbR-like HD superfamily hydrolase
MINLSTHEILFPNSLDDYKRIIKERVDFLVDDGILKEYKLLKQLKKPRRGWLQSGIHQDIAETTFEHSEKLKIAGRSYCLSPYSDVSEPELIPMLDAHDHIDAIFFDITPKDKISLAQKEMMEEYGMNLLYGNVSNGLGHLMLYRYSLFNKRNTRESEIGYFLDKQDAGTQARVYQNNFEDIIEQFYKNNPDKESFLYGLDDSIYPKVNNLNSALNLVYESLNRFYPYNLDRLDEGFMQYIAESVKRYDESDVYDFYYNLLNTINPKEFIGYNADRNI